MCSDNKSYRPLPWSDSPQVGIRAVVRIRVRARILGSGLYARVLGHEAWARSVGIDLSRPLNRNIGPKTMIPT